ncbi:MAG: citramalate synthase [Rhodobacteraceae bacterium]|nr:citramalate synthase [Paracoccaceae bacterium]
MTGRYPAIVYTEEVMREGMQIEDVGIPVQSKIALLDRLSETGLKNIVVGSFVSPKYTPQMKNIEEVLKGFTPREGVIYTAMIPNAKGLERAKEYAPPLTIGRGKAIPRLSVHQCDVFVRRNYNKSQMSEMSGWLKTVRDAQAKGATEAGIGTNASFGSNFLGDFPVESTIAFLERQHALWTAAGIAVTSVSIGDPMGWCHPEKVERIFAHVKERWPDVTDFRAHLHNSRGMALTSAYAAIKVLDGHDTLRVEGTLGGVGGCPYCGNGRATGMIATEDFMHMLEGMGIETGVDLKKLIECVWMLEDMLGRPAWGHVSRAGPRAASRVELLSPNTPFVETLEQATHFLRGPGVYEGGIVPWSEEITSPYLERLDQGLPTFEAAEGEWPWKQDFFPQVADLAREEVRP